MKTKYVVDSRLLRCKELKIEVALLDDGTVWGTLVELRGSEDATDIAELMYENGERTRCDPEWIGADSIGVNPSIEDVAGVLKEYAKYWTGKEQLVFSVPASYKRKQRGSLHRAWAMLVKNRDGNACLECGSTSDLHAHHIRDYASHEELRYDLDNGMTLCGDCHRSKHGLTTKSKDEILLRMWENDRQQEVADRLESAGLKDVADKLRGCGRVVIPRTWAVRYFGHREAEYYWCNVDYNRGIFFVSEERIDDIASFNPTHFLRIPSED